MMMDTAMQPQGDPNGQAIVTNNERLALIQKLYEEILLFFRIECLLLLSDNRNGHWNYQSVSKAKHMKNRMELK